MGKQILSQLPFVTVLLLFPDTMISSSFATLIVDVSFISCTVFGLGSSISSTVWKALGLCSKATELTLAVVCLRQAVSPVSLEGV